MHKCGSRDKRGYEASDFGAQRSRVNRRAVLKATAGGAAGVSLAGCLGNYDAVFGTSSEADEAITIGMLAPDPKSYFIGQSMAQSARVAVDELNENGGIGGRDVELVVGNTKGSPLEARRQYQRLVLEEGADVTTGIFDSAALVNVLDDIAEQRTIHLTSGAATREASRRVREEYDRYKYHFRVGPTNDADLGYAQINFMNDYATEIGWNRIAVLAEDYQWADKPWEIYQEELADTPVDVVYENRYPPETRDFTEIYTKAARAGADAAFITTAHTGNHALTYWKEGEFPFAFGGIHVPMQLPTYFEATDGRCEYGIAYATATEESEITDKTQHFVQKYHEKYESYPQDMGYNTYDAVMLYADAVEEAGRTDEDQLIPVLEDIEFTGSTGPIRFYDTDHDYPHDVVYDPETPSGIYFQWQRNDAGEGVREVIWPEEHKTAEYQRPPWL